MNENVGSTSFSPIELLHFDVNFALKCISTQLEQKDYKWYFIKSDRELFNVSAFTNYVESTPLANHTRIKDILEKSIRVVYLHNNEFLTLEKTKLDKSVTIQQDEGEGFTNISVPFECLRIEGKAKSFVLPSSYQDFFFPEPQCYHSNAFAKKCSVIINVITAFFGDYKDMTFYADVVNALYVKNTAIENTFFTPFEFIEEKHKVAKFKGKVFYENILTELPKHWRAKTPLINGQHFSEDCLTFVNYCKTKIETYQNNAKQIETVKQSLEQPSDIFEKMVRLFTQLGILDFNLIEGEEITVDLDKYDYRMYNEVNDLKVSFKQHYLKTETPTFNEFCNKVLTELKRLKEVNTMPFDFGVKLDFKEVIYTIEPENFKAYLSISHKYINELSTYVANYVPDNYIIQASTLQTPQQRVVSTESTASLKLESLFENISRYRYVMNLLVEKNHCQFGTYLWKDELKGSKSLIVSIIKDLHKKGYFKSNIKPSNDAIKVIAANTFGIEIGVDSIKKAKPDSHDLNFIPLASTLP